MLHDRNDIAAALTEAARSINSHRSIDDTLEAIVRAAQQTVPGFEHVGISITHGNGRIETRAGTGQLVWDIDELQYKLHEGPCYDAITSGGVTTMPDIATEQRWPRYVEEAAQHGLAAQMGLQLYSDESTLGGLNFYSWQPGIDPDAIQLAELFAAHASIALGRARHEHQLNESVTTRQAIGTAIGIVMERYRIPEDRAFQFLVRASSTGNVKLRTIAQEVVDTANRDFAVPAAEGG
ncbi:GAF and ANTAR domain-containing protein [Nocardioides nitrophenolicus]|uniref:GAF and ANTAR domain-containing protein n=1 Tax=Nocardioides nitrophenolicus TaxID=60489 RepID=UPI001957BB64|nr:GAF and ANTAR domain-containing protein [Nocardioides nitrophenolicus]MBM7515924.1 GAF domain-containing protein [Nocardioides nitrophenolicus]